MTIPEFYNFQTGGRGDQAVSMLMAAIPILPVGTGGGAVDAALQSAQKFENLVLIYHLFMQETDPLCFIVPSRR